MIMAGGTGGHVFPGIAVADFLRQENIDVVWMGTKNGLEATVVPKANIEIEWITIKGLRNKGLRGWLMLPLRLFVAVMQALAILRRRRPDAVLALGGFVAGPGALSAWLLRRPLLMHEQNAIPGLTNRIVSLFAAKVLCGFPGAFGKLSSARHVGNPVRADLADVEAPQTRFDNRQGALRLLIIGGSQGAVKLNQVVPQAVCQLSRIVDLQVRHQCGSSRQGATEEAYQDCQAEIKVEAFIDDMKTAYAWADLVICRAGAMTIAELSAVGVAAILVPYPHAVDDHQTANANYLVERNAAVLLPETDLNSEHLGTLIADFADNRQLLKEMAIQARACAMPDAAEMVATACMEAMHA